MLKTRRPKLRPIKLALSDLRNVTGGTCGGSCGCSCCKSSNKAADAFDGYIRSDDAGC